MQIRNEMIVSGMSAGEVEFPLTLGSQDAKGNILKMKLHFGVDGATKGRLDRTQIRLPVFRFVCLVSSASRSSMTLISNAS
jgi:hypothetical protein